MFGLICKDDIGLVGHSLFNNYRLSLYNYFGQDKFKDVNSVNDIHDMTHLFIIDEHFEPNKNIWKNDDFQGVVNKDKIRVIVFNFEKIYNSYFPWNVDNQNCLMCFNDYYQFVADLDDAKTLKKVVITKQFLSRDTNLLVKANPNKFDKILFIGQLDGEQYNNRRQLLASIKNLNIDVIQTNRRFSYIDFLNEMNKYRFILNPLGTGKFVNLRHFEAVRLGCIPLQQVVDDMVDWCQEIKKTSICFSDPMTIEDKIKEAHAFRPKEFFLEDYFADICLDNFM